jgi:hypothetical protein
MWKTPVAICSPSAASGVFASDTRSNVALGSTTQAAMDLRTPPSSLAWQASSDASGPPLCQLPEHSRVALIRAEPLSNGPVAVTTWTWSVNSAHRQPVVPGYAPILPWPTSVSRETKTPVTEQRNRMHRIATALIVWVWQKEYRFLIQPASRDEVLRLAMHSA